ncbi:MAG: TRAP transporter small permease [Synergistales bacterium]|nr:TRAP transporter small permease [Synergistales bacterium]
MSFVMAIKNSMVWRWLVGLQRTLLVLTSVFVVLIMCVEVMLRYVFKSDLFGIEEIVVVASFWLYFMGSSFGVYEKSHVKADIVPQLLKYKGRMVLNLMVRATVASLCLIFAYWAIDMVRYSIIWMPRTTGLRIPIFISQLSILVGYALMSFYSVIYFFEDLFASITGEWQDTTGQEDERDEMCAV